MTQTLLNRTTATKENALTEAERDAVPDRAADRPTRDPAARTAGRT